VNAQEKSAHGGFMPIPEGQALILPVLRILSDREQHPVEEIRGRIANDFGVTPEELKRMPLKGTSTMFANHVAFAFKYLVEGKAITRESKKEAGYRMTEPRGRAIWEACKDRKEITLKELRAF
jgi:restriction system protein